MVNKDE